MKTTRLRHYHCGNVRRMQIISSTARVQDHVSPDTGLSGCSDALACTITMPALHNTQIR
ncbi:hypothetical protein [Alteromonas sp. CYL-A6]|uniref:hypothetical protein n=1 Tax=Alteromonas nitratireducens TaxID=3390813 RepID=UPI0034C3BBC2